MFKISKILGRLMMLGLLSMALGLILLSSPNKVQAGEPCPSLCVNGLVCYTKFIPRVGCVQTDYCYPPDYEGQCPID
jgi:hypothetical protein